MALSARANKDFIQAETERNLISRLCPAIPEDRVKLLLTFTEQMCARDSPNMKLSVLIDAYASFMGIGESNAKRTLLVRLRNPGVTTPLHYTTKMATDLKSTQAGVFSLKSKVSNVEITPLGITQLLSGSSLLETQFLTVQAALRQEYQSTITGVQRVKQQVVATNEDYYKPVRAERQEAIAGLGAGYSNQYGFGGWCDLQAQESLIHGYDSPSEAAKDVIPPELLPSGRLHPMQLFVPGGKAAASVVIWKQELKLRELGQQIAAEEAANAAPIPEERKRKRAREAIYDVSNAVRGNDFLPRLADPHANASLYFNPLPVIRRAITNAREENGLV